MPIPVYIAPFRWYEKSKQKEASYYNHMVEEAFMLWAQATGGQVQFRLVATVNESIIDVKWRRVDRHSLGHCVYNWDKQGRIYSAEIEIGLSDGVLHSRYNNPAEVRHTILHEVGHALGLVGHSPYPGDIMYVPHQYGVISLSERDKETMRSLYELPVGFDYLEHGESLQLNPPFTIDDVFAVMKGWPEAPLQGLLAKAKQVQNAAPAAMPHTQSTEALDRQQQLLAQRGQFYLATSHLIHTVQQAPVILPPLPRKLNEPETLG
jgi:hypothetical protein